MANVWQKIENVIGIGNIDFSIFTVFAIHVLSMLFNF